MKKTRLIILYIFIINLLITPSILSGEEIFNYDSKNKRDPFIPLVTKSGVYTPSLAMNIESVADIFLEGTMVDPQGRSLAIVNGQVIKVGDQIGVFKVIRIEAARMIISDNNREYIINLSSK